jgi:ribosomal protein S27AE
MKHGLEAKAMEKIVLSSLQTREEEKNDIDASRGLTAITPCPRCGSLTLTHTGQYICQNCGTMFTKIGSGGVLMDRIGLLRY